MTTTTPAVRSPHAIPPGRLDWLRLALVEWQADGLVSPEQSAAILGRYRAGRRLSLGRLLLAVGALFVGVGLIWLVAANLDAWPPLVRVVVVVALWLAALGTGEALHARRASPSGVGAVRLLAALGFGAVVFQAAQSLQVPAHEPVLVGVWALGALAHAYVADARPPLLVGLGTGIAWLLSEVLETEPSGLAVVLGAIAAGLLAVAVAALHLLRRPDFAPAWREVGAGLLLVGLFAAALPFVGTDGFRWTPALAVALVAAALAATAAGLLAPGEGRLETLGALAVAVAALALVFWDAGDADAPLTANAVAHAAASVVLYVVAAVAVAALGTLRDSPRLTGLATAALVVFTTFQSFAVFARIVTGAWLFLLLGVVFLATGVLFDRARRQIATTLEPERAPHAGPGATPGDTP